MASSTVLNLAPLPPDTAAKWLPVDAKDREMVWRWLLVMRQMDRHYLGESPAAFGNTMAHRVWEYGGSFYYWTPESEIVLRMVHDPRRKMFHILSAGFVGRISPAAALDLIVDQAISFLGNLNVTSAFAIAPKQMDNPRILELYDLVSRHPRLHVTVERDGRMARRWKLEAPELISP